MVILVMVIIVIFTVMYFLYKYKTPEFYTMSPITGNIYISGITGAKDLAAIKRNDIQYVINCTKDIPNYYENKHIKYMRVPIDDSPDQPIGNYFEKTSDFIENIVRKNKNVLVHCYAGVSRSASIVIAYLIIKRHMKYADAIKLVASRRSIINPNPGFVNALKKLTRD
jgi:protein-tyrosine phosphatase